MAEKHVSQEAAPAAPETPSPFTEIETDTGAKIRVPTETLDKIKALRAKIKGNVIFQYNENEGKDRKGNDTIMRWATFSVRDGAGRERVPTGRKGNPRTSDLSIIAGYLIENGLQDHPAVQLLAAMAVLGANAVPGGGRKTTTATI